MSVGGLILAGGRSTRMGGSDKAMTFLGGRTLLAHAIARLAPQVDELAVSSNTLDPGSIDVPIIADATRTFDGPLAGILAGLELAKSSGHRAVASVAVDSPFFPHDLVRRLAEGDGQRVRVASSGGRTHPVFALWPVASFEPLGAFLARGETRKVMAFLDEFGFDEVEFATAPFDPFFNVNAPGDLVEAGLILESTGS